MLNKQLVFICLIVIAAIGIPAILFLSKQQQEIRGRAQLSSPTRLPEGNNGIAASYPGDVSIQSDTNVIFADNFESYTSASQLTSNWNSYFQTGNTRISTEANNVFSGTHAIEFTEPQTTTEISNALVKNISPTQDSLFVRVYTKFESGFDVTIPGHNGIRISSQYPGPGQTPNGSNFFLFLLENSTYYNEAEPGFTHVYAYHPEQRSQYGDHWYPDGKVLPLDATPGNFGSSFIPRPNFIPQTNRWYSYELMVKTNSPGQRDGRVTIWIDGVIVADFQNVRMRDVSNLKIDQIQLELHAQSNTARADKKWYDNFVVAKSYIGPISNTTPPTITLASSPSPTFHPTSTLHCLGSCPTAPISPTITEESGRNIPPTIIDQQHPDNERKPGNDNKGFIQIILELITKILVLLQLLIGLRA